MSASTTAPEPLDRKDLSAWKRLALLSEAEREELIAEWARDAGVDPNTFLARISQEWRWTGRPKQLAPPGQWMFWFIRAGRGFGKTLSAAQWIKEKTEEPFPGIADEEGVTYRIALIAPTLGDVRGTMVEGETGLLAILPSASLRGGVRETAWNRGTCELFLANGTYMKGFSSDVPGRLRGPQHHYVWGEEFSSWLDAKMGDAMVGSKELSTFTNMKLGLRLGTLPQAVLTSTPKANKLTKDVLKLPRLVMSTGSSFENRDNLSEAWWEAVVAPLIGTRAGMQEIEAKILDDVEGALWRLADLERRRVKPEAVPDLVRKIVAVDPNISSEEAANEAGIVVAGRDNLNGMKRRMFVIADRTVDGGPYAWAKEAVAAYHDEQCDCIVAEKNQGGDMVKITIHAVDPNVPVKLVHASRGKRPRAEPVAALYESSELNPAGRVFHVGIFPDLEEQMTTWVPEMDSPDRMDALVWAGTDLLLGPSGQIKTSRPKGRLPGV